MQTIKLILASAGCLLLMSGTSCVGPIREENNNASLRERISVNDNWRFFKYDSLADDLIYDNRPEVSNYIDNRPADSKPDEALALQSGSTVLKPWILPSGNDFISDPDNHYERPEGNPGNDFPFVLDDFDDSAWTLLDLPHDWAVEGPFYEGPNPVVGGGMGRLPSPGVAWYRKKLNIPESDSAKSIFLEVDGAMSYAMVWLNGNLAGGWPFGYASWQLDLTPWIKPGGINQLAIRLDNPPNSSRWYPGGGIYRDVWITKTNPVHTDQWGTFITSEDISSESAKVNLSLIIENDTEEDVVINAITEIYNLDKENNMTGKAVLSIKNPNVPVKARGKAKTKSSGVIKNPKLWGPPPTQKPNLYLAVTTLFRDEKPVDCYETRFGIRSLRFDPDNGIFVNGELIKIKGVNQHHDLGALGAAFNKRAAERQLEMLREMGCNAIRMSHNPPAPGLLELTDRMGFLVMDEAFDVWERRKTPLDFHLIFPDWHEQDLRAMIRRDRNCPSVVLWSYGNEVGEQYTGEEGTALAARLSNIIKEEDPTRPTTSSMNWAKPDMPFAAVMDVISLNYQGEGIRDTPEFEGTDRIRTSPQYSAFHSSFPDNVIISSETASAFSSRGVYLFPVSKELSSPVRDGRGGDSRIHHVSSYELHTVDFGATADKVFRSVEKHPFVAGEFVWTGWDHLGEPTPYYDSRSSYCGIIDLAGFKKDRFYLYQSHWRPDYPMAHILPHWNWPDRTGEITPVHVFTSGDEAELFLNGISMGRKKKGAYEYRLRWDDVIYSPGELMVIAYKNGSKWAEDVVKTSGKPAALKAVTDRHSIMSDGKDLAFITVKVIDNQKRLVPLSDNLIEFTIEGPGDILATDNGDPTDMTPFPSHKRKAFNGLALVIVRSHKDDDGKIKLTVKSDGLESSSVIINSRSAVR